MIISRKTSGFTFLFFIFIYLDVPIKISNTDSLKIKNVLRMCKNYEVALSDERKILCLRRELLQAERRVLHEKQAYFALQRKMYGYKS